VQLPRPSPGRRNRHRYRDSSFDCSSRTYYGLANASAFTQPADQRRWPRALNIFGVTGCAALVAPC
jgi:hypothetical protein